MTTPMRIRTHRVFAARRGVVAALSVTVRNGPLRRARRRACRSPDDLTGYWVSVVTELWRYRMLVPDKGDYVKIPLNPEGRKIASAWDPAKDQASGNECKSYGAAALLQVPGRLHIYWQDDNTLRMDTDSGTQTRLFHFDGSPRANDAPTWQGLLGRRCGAETSQGTGVTARAGLCRIRRANWSSPTHSRRKPTI